MTQAAVDWERRRYLELFEFAPVGLIVTDPQGKILEINRAATALFGIEPGFLVGRPLFAYLKSASGEGLDWLALQEAARADGGGRH